MEKALESEQNRVADLSNKIAFYGDAYKRLQGKLTAAENAVNNIKKELANQKKKYSELSTKLAYTEKELQGKLRSIVESERVCPVSLCVCAQGFAAKRMLLLKS